MITIDKKRSGTSTFGMFAEYVELNETGTMKRHVRLFLARHTISRYSRVPHTKRAAWRIRKYDTPEMAYEKFIEIVKSVGDNPLTRTIGEIVLAELTVNDLTQMDAGNPPPTRHTAVVANERQYGKLDDNTVWPIDGPGPVLAPPAGATLPGATPTAAVDEEPPFVVVATYPDDDSIKLWDLPEGIWKEIK